MFARIPFRAADARSAAVTSILTTLATFYRFLSLAVCRFATSKASIISHIGALTSDGSRCNFSTQ